MDNSSLIVGWFLGVASAVFVDRIGLAVATKRASEVILTELEELRLQFTFVLFKLKSKLGVLVLDDLEAMKKVAGDYRGAKRNAQFEKFCKTVNEMDEAGLQLILAVGEKPGSGVGLKTLITPAIDNSIEAVGGFPKPYQAAVLEIRRLVGTINQEVETSLEYHKMTFDTSIVDGNRDAVIGNTETAWKTIVDQAEDAIEIINQTDEYRGRTFWSFLF